MVLITLREKEQILEKLPNACVHRTVRQKSERHKYYLEEHRDAMRVLAELRGETLKERGNRNARHNKKSNRV